MFVTRASKAWIPELIAAATPEVTETYIDFLTATFRNRNTRAAYARACWQFFDWCATPGLELTSVRPFHVAAWIEERCGCCTILWSFGNLRRRIRHMLFARQSMWSRKARHPSGAAKRPKRCWIQSQSTRVRITGPGAHCRDA